MRPSGNNILFLQLQFDKLVFTSTGTDLLSVSQAALPLGVRGAVVEVVMTLAAFGILLQIPGQLASRQRVSSAAEVCTGLVDCDHISGGQHTDIRQDGYIVLRVAVAVGRYIYNKAQMELRTAGYQSGSVFSHSDVHLLAAAPFLRNNGVCGAEAEAAAAAEALIDINGTLAVGDRWSTVSANGYAFAAAYALLLLYHHFAVAVHFHLTGPAAAAHADILDGAAEAGHFVTLEVGESNDNISVCQCTAHLCFLHQLTIRYREECFIGTLQTIGDNSMTADTEWIESVFKGRVKMLKSFLAAADIESIAVGNEGFAALFPDKVNYSLYVVRTEVGDISPLTEVHLDGNEFALHINISQTCLLSQLFQLLRQRSSAVAGDEIGKINLGFFHDKTSDTTKNFYKYRLIIFRTDRKNTFNRNSLSPTP